MNHRNVGFAVLAVLAIGLSFAGQASAQDGVPVPAVYWSNNLQAQQAPAQDQTFTGTVAKTEDGKFVLQVGEEQFQLDNQKEAARYEGMTVKITGVLDAQTKTISIKSIERAA